MLRDRVGQTSTTTGTGDVYLTGTLNGLLPFATPYSNNDACCILIVDGNNFEERESTFLNDAGGQRVSRSGRLIRSTTGATLNLGAGTKSVYAVAAAEHYGPLGDALRFNTTGGTSTALTLTTPIPVPTYKDGMLFYVRLHTAPGTNATINPNGLGARQLRFPGASTGLVNGDVAAGLAILQYDATSTVMRIVYPAFPSMSGKAGSYLRVNSAGTLPEYVTPAQAALDIAPSLVLSGNMIINGSGAVAQRGADIATNALPSWLTDGYTLDRWKLNDQGTVGARVQRLYDSSDGLPFIRLSRVAGSPQIDYFQRLETASLRELIGRQVVTWFMARRSATAVGALYHEMRTTDGENDYNNQTTRFSYQYSSLSTNWTLYYQVVTLPSTAQAGGLFLFSIYGLTTAAANYVDLRYGGIIPAAYAPSTPPITSFAEEMALCQRFCRSTYGPNVAPGTANATAGQISWRTPYAETWLFGLRDFFGVPMRAIPTPIPFSPVTGTPWRVRNANTLADVTINSMSDAGVLTTGYPVVGSSVTAAHLLQAHFLSPAEIV